MFNIKRLINVCKIMIKTKYIDKTLTGVVTGS